MHSTGNNRVITSTMNKEITSTMNKKKCLPLSLHLYILMLFIIIVYGAVAWYLKMPCTDNEIIGILKDKLYIDHSHTSLYFIYDNNGTYAKYWMNVNLTTTENLYYRKGRDYILYQECANDGLSLVPTYFYNYFIIGSYVIFLLTYLLLGMFYFYKVGQAMMASPPLESELVNVIKN